MANHNPEPHPENLTPWKRGQSGNPAGYSKGRHLGNAIHAYLDSLEGSEKDIARTVYAMATGRKYMLKEMVIDPETNAEVWVTREPNIACMEILIERVDGKAPKSKFNETLIDMLTTAIDDADKLLSAVPAGGQGFANVGLRHVV